jgi:hypothetical protein
MYIIILYVYVRTLLVCAHTIVLSVVCVCELTRNGERTTFCSSSLHFVLFFLKSMNNLNKETCLEEMMDEENAVSFHNCR